MRRGSTPIVSITVPNEDFTNCNVFVTLDQDGTQITKESRATNDIQIVKNLDDAGNLVSSTVAVYLTQEDTMKFEVGQARVQIRWIDLLGHAYVTDIASVKLNETLLEGVIEYGN